MENEFEDIADDFLDEDKAPTSNDDDIPTEDPETSNNMVSTGDRGTSYDWNSAPDQVRAPERIDLDGQIVTIKKAEIILPSENVKWQIPFKGDKKNVYKGCKFILYYDVDGQQEFYSGVKVFKADDGKYSHPSIPKNKEGKQSQVTKLLFAYAKFKEKDIEEISLREFMAFLNSKPKAKIKVVEVENPENGKMVNKNMVHEFIN